MFTLNRRGDQIKDSHLSAILLCSMPESYAVLITALESHLKDELSVEYIKTKLTGEYERRTLK